jgi:hypothetical protein
MNGGRREAAGTLGVSATAINGGVRSLGNQFGIEIP